MSAEPGAGAPAADERRQRLLLGALLAVLLLVVWWQFGGQAGTASTAPARPSPAASGAARGAAASPDAILAEGVALARLDEDRPAPEDGGRDPFRRGRTAGETPASGGGSAGLLPSTPTAPPVVSGPVVSPGPPPPPPITVKFIGIVQRQGVGRVAVLSDGKNVYYGRAGEIVDGRWRIVSIGEESLQIEWADGRGRQTVRLTG